MPRKSKELRKQQAHDLATQYNNEGLGNDYRARFIRDMISRLDRNKGLSKRQREWLDSLIAEGIPKPKGNPQLLQSIREALAVEGLPSRDREIITEF